MLKSRLDNLQISRRKLYGTKQTERGVTSESECGLWSTDTFFHGFVFALVFLCLKTNMKDTGGKSARIKQAVTGVITSESECGQT